MSAEKGSCMPIRRIFIALGVVVGCLTLFMFIRGKSSQDKGTLAQLYNYKYEKMKLALEEKEQQLQETFKVLEQTTAANKKQEQLLQELKKKVAEQDRELKLRKEALHKRDVAVRLMEEAEQQKEAALQATQLCRQEAAAALQEKEYKIAQADQGLDMARREVGTLQESLDHHQNELQRHRRESTHAIKTLHGDIATHRKRIADKHRAMEWLAEKMRQQHDQIHGK